MIDLKTQRIKNLFENTSPECSAKIISTIKKRTNAKSIKMPVLSQENILSADECDILTAEVCYIILNLSNTEAEITLFLLEAIKEEYNYDCKQLINTTY